MAIEVGGVVEGTVTGSTKFGAFADLGDDKVGLVHISEVADVYVNDVKDFLNEGQKVKVKVLTIDENGKIGLSIKRLQPKKPEQTQPQAPRAAAAGTGNRFSHAPHAAHAPHRPMGGGDFHRPAGRFSSGPLSFEDKLSKFLKDSDERLTDLKKKTDSKRGGRGARRSS